ncbi:MAG: signal peptidase II [Actinomycetota bacterium]
MGSPDAEPAPTRHAEPPPAEPRPAGDLLPARDVTPSPRGTSKRSRLAFVLYSVAAALYLLDRVTKLVAEHQLIGRPRTLIPGVLQLQYTENSGGAFGVFGGAVWLFLTATLLVCAVIVFASFNLPNRTLGVALGLVLGGATGNLTDRAIRGTGFFGGRVIDFLAFARSPRARPVWPVFNLADAAIVAGAALILLASVRKTAHR